MNDNSEKGTATTVLGTRPIEVVDKIPTPEEVFKVPKIDVRTLFVKVLGPATIPLGMAIGSGEWLLGPAIVAKYGFLMAWLIWVGTTLQTIYNISWARLTVLLENRQQFCLAGSLQDLGSGADL